MFAAKEQIMATINNRQRWLRRAGLIVGLAGVIWLTLFIFAISAGEGILLFWRFSWHSLPAVTVFVLPLLALIAIAWKWPVVGGILLIAGGLFWPVWRFIISPYPPITPLSLSFVAYAILPVSLLPFVSGILFLLSRGVAGRGE
jgi:hypothetical protein